MAGDGHSVSVVRVGEGVREVGTFSAMTISSDLHDILKTCAPLPPFCINVRLERRVSIARRRSTWLRLYGER